MQNRHNKNIFTKKGFYVILYSCIAVMAIVASVLTYSNLNSMQMSRLQAKTAQLPQESPENLAEVINNQAKSYLTPSDKSSLLQDKILEDSTIQNATEKQTESKEKDSANTDAEDLSKPTEQIQNESKPSNALSEDLNTTDTDEDFQTADYTENFNGFDETQKMTWPVFGEIAMDYSTEHAIYDKTLEQYRTNDSICISSPLGTQVKSTAEGVVKLITKTEQGGNTVVIDNGNGWNTIYSQLEDNVLVNEGEKVEQGQIIGGIGSPSKYEILLGNHLNFKVTKDDMPVDPKTVLSE